MLQRFPTKWLHFVEENASSSQKLEHDPIPQERIML